MSDRLTDTEAWAALDAVEHSRRRVIDEIAMPTWYWWGLAIGWVALGVVTDVANPWIGIAATLAFGTAHAAVAPRVLGGRHRTAQLSVRAEVAGRHVPLLVFASLVLLGALTVVGALVAGADGAGHPVTIASIVVAVLILLGGPQLMAGVRRRAARSSMVP